MALNLVLNLVLTVATDVVALSMKHCRHLSHVYLAGISCITAVLAYHCDHTLIATIQGSPPSSISSISSSVISNQSCVLHAGALIPFLLTPNFNHIRNSLFFMFLLIIIIFEWRKATKFPDYLVQCTISSHSRSLR